MMQHFISLNFYNHIYNFISLGNRRQHSTGIPNVNRYVNANQINKQTILQAYEIIKNNPEFNTNVAYIGLKGFLEDRVVNNNFIHGYVYNDSFVNIPIMDDEILSSENVAYRLRFESILNSLLSNRIYKMVFRWETVEIDDVGRRKSQYNSSPSFFIHKGLDIDVVLYRFNYYLNNFINQYSISENINLDIFTKEWIDYNDFKNFDKILSTIKQKDAEFKKRMLKSSGSEISQEKNNSFFKNYLAGKKIYLVEYIKGLNYGDLVSSSLKLELFKKLNIELSKIDQIDFYTNIINGRCYIIKVDKISSSSNEGGGAVSVYLNSYLESLTIVHDSSNGTHPSEPRPQISTGTSLSEAQPLSNTFTNSEYLVIESWTDTIGEHQPLVNSELDPSGVHSGLVVASEEHSSGLVASEDHPSGLVVTRTSLLSGHTITFVNNEAVRTDIRFNSKQLLESYRNFDKDNNIGTIDIESYTNDQNEAVAYSIGYKTDKLLQTFYLDSFDSTHSMILSCIESMLTKDNHRYSFYAHNMGEFDGILILKSLMLRSDELGLTLKTFSNNEGKLISIEISKKIAHKKSIKISILDSYLLLPQSLSKLASVFNCNVQKSVFPYEFMAASTISYRGDVPAYSYFANGMSLESYTEYASNYVENNLVWDSKLETIKYLENDLNSLYEVMMSFNKIIFRQFGVNITRVRTISGLAFLIFTSKYYSPKTTPIYFTKGKIENFIREGYHEGIVDVVTNYTNKLCYKFNVNSHYPNSMKLTMPGGKPKISSETDLDKAFGFVEAKVEAPTEAELRVAILPIRRDGKTVLFRGTATGVWFSEELKMARSYGYKIHKIISCLQFERVDGTFNKYIDDIFALKKEADLEKNNVLTMIFKSLLNSLYGRLALKSDQTKLSIVRSAVEDSKLTKISLTEQSEVLIRGNNLNLVLSRGPLDSDIVQLVNEEKLYKVNRLEFHATDPWAGKGSSVQYSAAISAYARMYLNQFKNIPGNDYLGGDTASIILSKPLDSKYVGNNLGQFKLEYVKK